MRVAGVDLDDPRPVGGGDICRAVRASTADGREVFAKTLAAPPPRFFAAEADGLRLLRGAPGGPPVPEIVAVADDGIVLEWVHPGPATRAAAESFGRALATMHASHLPTFGAERDGYIGTLPLDNTPRDDWPAFYVERRVRPYLAALDADHRGAVERLCERIDEVAGPPEPPARIHGDLWSGNLLWAAAGAVWLVDAASAHGGHRETDLAMLELFGAPHLDAVLAAYAEVAPLAPGRRERVALHQVHPLLVHATLFRGGYGARAAAAATAALRA